jgi:photosystem II stability/assembly factor-like uncharacterized protein
VLYAVVEGVLNKTSDGGASWSPDGGLTNLSPIRGVAVNPAEPSTVLAISFDGLFLSRDAATTWTRLVGFAGGSSGNRGPHVGFDPETPGKFWATAANEVCRSTDLGTTWSCTDVGAPVVSLAFELSGQGAPAVFAGTLGRGVLVSTDDGGTWTPASEGLGVSVNVAALAADPAGTQLYAGTQEGVFRSSDGAAHWTEASSGLAAAWIGTLTTDPSSPGTIYAGSSLFGLFKSTDSGGSWARLDSENALLGSFTAFAQDPSDPSTLYAGAGLDVLKSTDGGEQWTSALRFNFGEQVTGIVVDATTPSTIHLGRSGFTEIVDGVLRSTDGGATWNPAGITQSVYALIGDSLRSPKLHAGSHFDWSAGYYYYYPGPVGGGLFTNPDGGQSWSKSPTDLQSPVTALAMDPLDSSILYAGTASSGFWKSTDGAATWSSLGSSGPAGAFGPPPGKVYSLAIDPAKPTRVFAGTDRGVYFSTDAGGHWGPLKDGLPDLIVTAVAIDPSDSRLFAGTIGGGVFDFDLVPASFPCAPEAGNLCLLGGRFQVTLLAENPLTGRTIVGHAVSQGDRFGYFSLPGYTLDPTFPEVVVKMVDARASAWQSFWFFYSQLTSLPYVVTITDTVTGQIRSYKSEGCGGGDISAFPAEDAGGLAWTAAAPPASSLSASGAELSLFSNRFHIALTARDPRTGRQGNGVAISQGDRFGYFSLPDFMGDPSFPEVFVKMVQATWLPERPFWLYHTGMTHLQYTLTVTDSESGVVRTYQNGGDFCGGVDRNAFPAGSP